LRADADVPRAWQKPERNQRDKKRKIEREMTDGAEIVTGSAEASAGDVDATKLRRERGDDKDNHERAKNRQCAKVKLPNE
jgi:hypothetical protein